MTTRARLLIGLSPVLLLAACGQKTDPALGGLTADQADGMNASANSLDRTDYAGSNDMSAVGPTNLTDNQTQD